MQQCRLRLCVMGKLSYIVVCPWLHGWLWHLWLMQMLISLIPYRKYISHCAHCSPPCQIVHANFNSPVSAYNCRQLYMIIFTTKCTLQTVWKIVRKTTSSNVWKVIGMSQLISYRIVFIFAQYNTYSTNSLISTRDELNRKALIEHQ